jgi:hypothetical protein
MKRLSSVITRVTVSLAGKVETVGVVFVR